MNLQQERKNHEIKLAIIEMIESCDERIKIENAFIEKIRSLSFFACVDNSVKNIGRYMEIKKYLKSRYERK